MKKERCIKENASVRFPNGVLTSGSIYRVDDEENEMVLYYTMDHLGLPFFIDGYDEGVYLVASYEGEAVLYRLWPGALSAIEYAVLRNNVANVFQQRHWTLLDILLLSASHFEFLARVRSSSEQEYCIFYQNGREVTIDLSYMDAIARWCQEQRSERNRS